MNKALIAAVEEASSATRRAIYKNLAQDLENITIELPACGEQTLEQRFGGTDLDVGNINVYATEGVVHVSVDNIPVVVVDQKGVRS